MSIVSGNRPVLQINTKAAKLNIKQNRPKLTIRHKRSKMKVRKRAPAFKINRSVSRVKTRRDPAVQISRRFTRTSFSSSSNFTERLTANASLQNSLDLESINLNEVENSAMEMIAAENKSTMTELETVSLEWDRGYFEIDWTSDVMEMDWDVTASPEIYVEPYDVEIYVRNNIRRNIRLSAVTLPGSRVDKRI